MPLSFLLPDLIGDARPALPPRAAVQPGPSADAASRQGGAGTNTRPAPAAPNVPDAAAEAAALLRARAIEMADALSHEVTAARAARMARERTAEEAVRALIGTLAPAAARATAEAACLDGLKELMARLAPARLEVQAPGSLLEALRAALSGAPEKADMIFTEVPEDAAVRVLWQDGEAVFDPVAAAEALTAHLTRAGDDTPRFPEGH